MDETSTVDRGGTPTQKKDRTERRWQTSHLPADQAHDGPSGPMPEGELAL